MSALPPATEKPPMLQNLAAEIIHCYERARQAREKAERAINDDFKAEFLSAEARWLALANSYEGQHRLSRTITEFDRHRKAGAIARMLRENVGTFDPDAITRLDIAYHAVLHQLGLVEREDGATLMVAKRIIDLGSRVRVRPRVVSGCNRRRPDEIGGSRKTGTYGSEASRGPQVSSGSAEQDLVFAGTEVVTGPVQDPRSLLPSAL
jgi:hypothetical protein